MLKQQGKYWPRRAQAQWDSPENGRVWRKSLGPSLVGVWQVGGAEVWGVGWNCSHLPCLENATLMVAMGPRGFAGDLQGLGHPRGNVPGRAEPAASPPLSAHSKLTRESGTDFPIPVIPPVPDVETEKLIREKDEEVSVVWPEPPNPCPLSLQPQSWHSCQEPPSLQHPSGCCCNQQGLEVHPKVPSSPALGDPNLFGMLSPCPLCTGAAWLGLGTIPDPASAPFQLRRMQEMLQKIQKQMKDSH